MKMKKLVSYVFVTMLLLLVASGAFAETFSPATCLYVSADINGVVTVKGDPADIAIINMMPQYFPDKFKTGNNGDNYYITPLSKIDTEVKFQINMAAAAKGKRAFQLKSGRLWLLLTNSLVVVGDNLILEMSQPNSDSEDGKGGAHFVFTPAINVKGGNE